MLRGEFEPALRALITEWNIAERRIKRAEQTRHGEVVISAIFELRYAGRKLIDAAHLALTEDAMNDEAVKARIKAFISEATEDCVKAKHDAIDSMLDFITRWFHEAEEAIGFGAVQRFFPNYISITATISDMQDKISASRGENRAALRDSIYDGLERDYFDEILAFTEPCCILRIGWWHSSNGTSEGPGSYCIARLAEWLGQLSPHC